MINPSVVAANPSDFVKLADGISSNYNNVKFQSDAKIKQCEASLDGKDDIGESKITDFL